MSSLHLLLALSVCFLCCLPCSLAGTAGGWKLYSDGPVLGPGLGVIFDVSVVALPSSYLLYNSWRSDNSSHAIDAIALATSSDGLAFNAADQRIVLPHGSAEWEMRVNRPSVLTQGKSGGFEMYYTGQSDNQSYIGVAHSPDGLQWQRQSSTPVLSPTVAWEKAAVMCPSILYNASATPSYRLYYSAGEQYEPDAIGVAYSDDGLQWEKAPQNPVLTPNTSAPWEAFKVTAAHVLPPTALMPYYLAFYVGFADVNTGSINLARSRDGLTQWQRHPANPIVSKGGSGDWTCDSVYKPSVVLSVRGDQPQWMLWFNGRCGSVEQIGLAVRTGLDLGFDEWPVVRRVVEE